MKKLFLLTVLTSSIDPLMVESKSMNKGISNIKIKSDSDNSKNNS